MISSSEGLTQLIEIENSIAQLKERIEISQDPPLNNEDIPHPVCSHTTQEVPHPPISDDLLDLPNPDDEFPVSDSGVNESGSTHSHAISSHSPQPASTISEQSSDVMATSQGDIPMNSLTTILPTNTEQLEELPVAALEENHSVCWSDDDKIKTQRSDDNPSPINYGSQVETVSENNCSHRDKTLLAFTSSSEDEGELRSRNTNLQAKKHMEGFSKTELSNDRVIEPVVVSDKDVRTESTCSNWESLYDDEMMQSSSVPVASADVDLSKSHLPQEREAVPDVDIEGWNPANNLDDEPSQTLEFDNWPSLPITSGNQTDVSPSSNRNRIRIPSDEVWDEISIPDNELSIPQSIPEPLTQTEQIVESSGQLNDVVDIPDQTTTPQAHFISEESGKICEGSEETEDLAITEAISVTSTTNVEVIRSDQIETVTSTTTDEQTPLSNNEASANIRIETPPLSNSATNEPIANSGHQTILLRTELTEASAIEHKGVELASRPHIPPPTHTESEGEELQSLEYSLDDQSNTAEDLPPELPPREMFANRMVTTQSYNHRPHRRSFPGSSQYEEFHPVQRYPGPPIINSRVNYPPSVPPRFRRQYVNSNEREKIHLSTPIQQNGVEGVYAAHPQDPMFSPAHVVYHYPPYHPSPPVYYQEGGVMYPPRPMNNEYAPRYVAYHQPPPYGYPMMPQPQYIPATPPVVTEQPLSPRLTKAPRRTSSAVPIRPASKNSKSAINISSAGLIHTREFDKSQQAVTKSSTQIPQPTVVESGVPAQVSTSSTPRPVVKAMAGVDVSPLTTATTLVGLGSGRAGRLNSVPKKRISARSVGLGRGLSPGLPRDRRPGSLTSSS